MSSVDRSVDPSPKSKIRLRWPSQLLGPRPGLKEANLVAWTLLAAFLIVPYCLFLGVQLKSGAQFYRSNHPDFVYFYGVGRIVNEYPAARLYDYNLQVQVFNELSPARAGYYGPSPYPPFVAHFFALFALLPFTTAYLLWAAISLLLYLTGIAAVAKVAQLRNGFELSLFFCFALAFYPFFVETMFNGQLAAVAVCCVGLVVLADRRAHPFASGIALSLLIYKPTLLVVLLPMLVLTRRFKALGGFIVGAAILFAATTGIAGFASWETYARFLSLFGRVTGVNGQSTLDLPKYIDLISISHLVRGGRSPLGLGILAAVALTVAAWLGVLLWRSAKGDKPVQCLAWAAALTWTLLLNFYVPLYDCSLVALSMLLTVAALQELDWKSPLRWSVLLALLIFAASWKTEAIAASYHVPLLSILLAALGVSQLFLLSRGLGQPSKREFCE